MLLTTSLNLKQQSESFLHIHPHISSKNKEVKLVKGSTVVRESPPKTANYSQFPLSTSPVPQNTYAAFPNLESVAISASKVKLSPASAKAMIRIYVDSKKHKIVIINPGDTQEKILPSVCFFNFISFSNKLFFFLGLF